MDEDMALQLSRARRETLSVPVAPHDATQTQPTIHESPSEQPAFPFALSSEEQRAIDFARGEHTTLDDAADDGALHIPRPPSPPSFLLPHVSAGHDPSLLVSAGQKHANSAGHPPSVFGLPSYQANVSSSNFDFSIMEEFAVVEKIQLGLGSPTVKFPVDPAAVTSSGTSFFSKLRRGADQPAAFSPLPPSGLSDANPYASPLPALPTRSNARQRKLSQSISSPRTHRKGIGGKMALFENMPGASSSAAPAMDPNAAAGATAEPRHGILNTGHDRPYRFSFYSNALSETIHARSLSELPADGQTFEELFTGISPSHKNDGSGWGSDPARDRPIVAPVPIPAPATSGGMSWTSSPGNLSVNGMNAVNSTSQIPPRNGNVHSNNGNGGNATKGVEHKTAVNNGGDVESKTWWLDVQSPTDEEMKMLSKVSISPTRCTPEGLTHLCSKVFSIHPLTTEDIQMEETREKIELFRHYYLVCFRSFDQDPYSPMHLEPLNMYIIVLREGTLSVSPNPSRWALSSLESLAVSRSPHPPPSERP
jgi:magnesium transporter